MDGDRVAKALARSGVASRREVERLIEAGRVAINGRVLDTPAVKISAGDILTVDGVPVDAAEAARVWRYHKPAGLLTSHGDPKGRPTVFEHLPKELPRVISIGRLDLASEGLLLLTNDGGLSRALEMPKTGLGAPVSRPRLRSRRSGQARHAEGRRHHRRASNYGPIEAKIDKAHASELDRKTGSANLWISVGITEGKNREVRRVLEHLGLKVNRLIRLAYGPFALGDLAPGEVQEVGPRVIREQLADFVSPANLPTGNRSGPGPVTRAAGPMPGRRPRAAGPTPAKTAAPPEPAPKKVFKAGWAKPVHKASPHKAKSGGKGVFKPKPKPEEAAFAAKPHRARPGPRPPAATATKRSAPSSRTPDRGPDRPPKARKPPR